MQQHQNLQPHWRQDLAPAGQFPADPGASGDSTRQHPAAPQNHWSIIVTMGFQQGSIRKAEIRDIDIRDLGTVDYEDTWHLQADLAAQRAEEKIPDTILLLQHPPTYTAGKRTEDSDRPTNGLPVVDVDRGGRITWHGPGQLVAYPIIKLADPVDVVDYVRRLEQALIQTCEDLGLHGTGRVEGRSGVWLPAGVINGELKPARKIAAIGIRVTRGVTMHGVSLNCDNTMEYYDHIVPCGLADAGVTTLTEELGHDVSVSDAHSLLARHLVDALNGDLQVDS